MRRADLLVGLALAALLAPLLLWPPALAGYERLNQAHPLVLSFLKFGALATFGEMLALRIRCGRYLEPGFGALPRAVIWGLLGLAIYAAFGIFAAGTPAFLRSVGVPVTPEVLSGPVSPLKLLAAFSISVAMNVIFAPVMMTTHKVTDAQIARTGGTLRGLLQPMPVGELLAGINWQVMWSFVLKKTIPLFWVPAHTVTFLLPPQHRVLFAALLSVALGVLLALGSAKAKVQVRLEV